MPKFRKKPVVIKAEQYMHLKSAPVPAGVCFCPVQGPKGDGIVMGMPHCHTLEGPMFVSHLDWIITGVKGERYPCKPDVFEMTYEPVEDSTRG